MFTFTSSFSAWWTPGSFSGFSTKPVLVRPLLQETFRDWSQCHRWRNQRHQHTPYPGYRSRPSSSGLRQTRRGASWGDEDPVRSRGWRRPAHRTLTNLYMQRATQRKEDYSTVLFRISPNLEIHMLKLTRRV